MNVIVGSPLKVAVIAELAERVFAPDAEGHGLVVPPQLLDVRLPDCALQPVNVEFDPALAEIR